MTDARVIQGQKRSLPNPYVLVESALGHSQTSPTAVLMSALCHKQKNSMNAEPYRSFPWPPAGPFCSVVGRNNHDFITGDFVTLRWCAKTSKAFRPLQRPDICLEAQGFL